MSCGCREPKYCSSCLEYDRGVDESHIAALAAERDSWRQTRERITAERDAAIAALAEIDTAMSWPESWASSREVCYADESKLVAREALAKLRGGG